MSDPNAFDEGMRRVEALVSDLERRGGVAADAARELVGAVLDVHEAGLTRALALVASEGEAGARVLAALERDPQVSSLLLLHGLHPAPLEARVRRVVESISTEVAARGGRVDATEIGPALVRVRLVRSGSLPGARARLEEMLLAAAPDAERIEIDEVVEPALVPAERLVHKEAGSAT